MRGSSSWRWRSICVGAFRLTKALFGALAASARDGRGALVINISSDAAVNAYPGWGAYGASKAALCPHDRDLGRGGERPRRQFPGDRPRRHGYAAARARAFPMPTRGVEAPGDAAAEIIEKMLAVLPRPRLQRVPGRLDDGRRRSRPVRRETGFVASGRQRAALAARRAGDAVRARRSGRCQRRRDLAGEPARNACGERRSGRDPACRLGGIRRCLPVRRDGVRAGDHRTRTEDRRRRRSCRRATGCSSGR